MRMRGQVSSSEGAILGATTSFSHLLGVDQPQCDLFTLSAGIEQPHGPVGVGRLVTWFAGWFVGWLVGVGKKGGGG